MKTEVLNCLLLCSIVLSLIFTIPVVAFDSTYRSYKSFYTEKTEDVWTRPKSWGPINDQGDNCYYIHPQIYCTNILEDAHVMWYGQSGLNYHRMNGDEWIEEVLPTIDVENNWYFEMNIDQDNVSHFYYVETSQGFYKTIMYNSYNRTNSTWGVPLPINTSIRSTLLSGEQTANGLIYISTVDGLWVGTANGSISRTIPGSRPLGRFISGNNYVELISRDNNNLLHEFSYNSGLSWSNKSQILEFTSGSGNPKVFKGRTGVNETFFILSRSSKSTHFMVKYIEGTNQYSPPINLSSSLKSIDLIHTILVDTESNIRVFGTSKSDLREAIIDRDGSLVSESLIASSSNHFEYIYAQINDQNTVQLVYITLYTGNSIYWLDPLIELLGLIILGILIIFGGFIILRRYIRDRKYNHLDIFSSSED